jgi:DNA-binding CsgD family transcriptional regulator
MRRLLTVREVEVAALLARGRSNREIAQQLMVSPETVKAHVTRIMRKLNASNRAEAVARYLQLLAART